MQLNNTEKMADDFCEWMSEKFEDRVDDFCILDVIDDENHREFSVEFTVYDYFPIRLNYEKGRFGCCIMYGDKEIGLENSQKWWDEANFDVFFKELQDEIELRIPEKFLKSRGWL